MRIILLSCGQKTQIKEHITCYWHKNVVATFSIYIITLNKLHLNLLIFLLSASMLTYHISQAFPFPAREPPVASTITRPLHANLLWEAWNSDWWMRLLLSLYTPNASKVRTCLNTSSLKDHKYTYLDTWMVAAGAEGIGCVCSYSTLAVQIFNCWNW